MNTEAIAAVEPMETLGHYINGAYVADTARSQDVFNPATGRAVRRVALAGKATVEEAIAAAEAAFPAWRDTPPIKRARVMTRFRELLEQHADEIVALITEEHGKVLNDAAGEFGRGVENVEYACYAPEFLKGEQGIQKRGVVARSHEVKQNRQGLWVGRSAPDASNRFGGGKANFRVLVRKGFQQNGQGL